MTVIQKKKKALYAKTDMVCNVCHKIQNDVLSFDIKRLTLPECGDVDGDTGYIEGHSKFNVCRECFYKQSYSNIIETHVKILTLR